MYLCRNENHEKYINQIKLLLNDLEIEYSDGFPYGLYGLNYLQSASINGKELLILDQKNSGQNIKKNQSLARAVRSLTPPLIYNRLTRVINKIRKQG